MGSRRMLWKQREHEMKGRERIDRSLPLNGCDTFHSESRSYGLRTPLLFPTSLHFLNKLDEDVAMARPRFAVANQFMAVEFQ